VKLLHVVMLHIYNLIFLFHLKVSILTKLNSLPAALGPGVHSASNRHEYRKQKNNNVSGEQNAAGEYNNRIGLQCLLQR
jgi:hypothetical protein